MSTEIKVTAFDTETEMMSYTNPVPDLMCMTYAEAGSPKGGICTPWEHKIDDTFIRGIAAGQHFVGHNVAFDLSILAWKYPHLLPHIFDALDKGLIHDTLLREKLLMLTLHGNFEMIEANGCNIRLAYGLADLEKKYLGIDRSDLKDDPDAPRNNYAMYKNVPLAKWHDSFITYAIDDAVNTGYIYQSQEIERANCIEVTGHDPYAVETFRVKVSFALRLLECVGSRMDTEKVEEVAERFRTEYAQPRLRNPLLESGLLLDAVPPQPYKNGAIAHLEICRHFGTKISKKSLAKDPCDCPPKMKDAVKEKNPTKPLFQYIWELAYKNPNIKAWPSDGCASDMRKAGTYDLFTKDKAFKHEIIAATLITNQINHIQDSMVTLVDRPRPFDEEMIRLKVQLEKLNMLRQEGITVLLPDDIKLKTDEEWASSFTAFDPLLLIWVERKALRKIITDYLPKMYYTGEDGVERPAKYIRGSFYPLCLTGRSSSSASKCYPSRNEQNVDPRVRPCTIAREGNIIVSTDYSGMELGTLAQKCFNLFGYSVMADNINKGVDTHAFLAAQIAMELDTVFCKKVLGGGVLSTDRDAIFGVFKELKTYKEECDSAVFCTNFKAKYKGENNKDLDRPVLWSDFFKYYRTLAKPTGLGFPGGLGAATMVAYAKGTYRVELTFELAQKLRDIWLETYPEMKEYLDWVTKSCKDPNHAPVMVEDDDGNEKKRTYFCYDTPKGMHRSRCGYCEAANGAALQAFSAEGALEGLYRVQKAMWLAKPEDVLFGSFPINFVHDEIIWETPGTEFVAKEKVDIIESIMVDAMEEITPNVKAGTESAAMRRWYKLADAVIDEKGNLVPWEPPIEKKGV